jgi:MFS family permease
MIQEKPLYSQRYRAYVLLVLTGVYTFNFIDRQILVIIQESIKAELGLSDTQLGLLTGLAFALFYVTLGIPIARFADRSNRRNIVALALAIWSAMTALSGLVGNYVQLLLARIGVGVGEAGGSPPAHSIISDYFPAEQRATALSIYSIGIYIGILAGFSIGGWIDATYGWRMAFFALGLPGVAYALLLLFTVKEPPKGHSDDGVAIIDNQENKIEKISSLTKEEKEEPSFMEVSKLLFSKKTFILLSIATGLHTFGNYGVGNFFAPFLSRVHEMPVQEIGTYLGICSGFGGIIGTFLGGYLADKLGKKDLRWYLWLSFLAGMLNFLPSFFLFLSNNTQLVLVCYFISSLLTAMYLGPSIAVTHSLIPAKIRAFSSAILLLILNIIGLGLGPLIIGLLSDYFEPSYGKESLRYAFLSTFFTGSVSILLFYLASKHYIKEAIYVQKKKLTNTVTANNNMKEVLNIVMGVLFLFFVGLFFLQIGLAGIALSAVSIWILILVGFLFISGLGLTIKGIIRGD